MSRTVTSLAAPCKLPKTFAALRLSIEIIQESLKAHMSKFCRSKLKYRERGGLSLILQVLITHSKTFLSFSHLQFYPILIILTPIKTSPTQNELHYSTYSQSSIPLPTLKDEATIQLSVIIPAYNEKDRLEIMLKDCIHHLETLKNNGKSLCQSSSSGGSEKIITNGIEGKLKEMNGNHSIETTNEFVRYLTDPFKSYEIILVDDGSKDDTSQIALDFSKKINKERIGEEEIEIRVVRLERNRGKGGAVRHVSYHLSL